jgi:hypothetical protein
VIADAHLERASSTATEEGRLPEISTRPESEMTEPQQLQRVVQAQQQAQQQAQPQQRFYQSAASGPGVMESTTNINSGYPGEIIKQASQFCIVKMNISAGKFARYVFDRRKPFGCIIALSEKTAAFIHPWA